MASKSVEIYMNRWHERGKYRNVARLLLWRRWHGKQHLFAKNIVGNQSNATYAGVELLAAKLVMANL